MKFFLLLALLASFAAFGAETKKPKPKAPVAGQIPYLGPGADKLSKEDYERIYKNYIQTSVLLGYPFLESAPQACDQAIGTVFRQAGMFGYPVPPDAPGVKRMTRVQSGKKVETYEMGGVIIQLARTNAGAPERLIWINSSSTKATRRLSQTVTREFLALEQDPITGLERVKGLPVGFPHPYLNAAGQGLFVKALQFNGKKDDCLPVEFTDNSWNSGFDLDSPRCGQLQGDAKAVWDGAMKPEDFRSRELERMKDRARKNALAKGVSESEARRLVEKHFTLPFTSEINVVGSAMRNLAQCNMMGLGEKERRVVTPDDGKPSLNSPGSGSAR